MIEVKICGLKRQKDIDYALSLGVNFCGFIFHKESPRYIKPRAVAKLKTGDAKRVGVFVSQDIDEIQQIIDQADLDFVQLHGGQSLECAKILGKERVIRVLWPERYATLAELQAEIDLHQNFCHFYLLDAGKMGGGSGQTLNWSDLAKIKFPKKWFLAGGLSEANIREAVLACYPDICDFNSGVEDAPGNKNAEKIFIAINCLRAATTEADARRAIILKTALNFIFGAINNNKKN